MNVLIRNTTALALVCLVFFRPAHADEDALSIIEKAFAAARANEVVARNYVFHERIEERRLNKKGEEKKRESRTYDVTLLDNSEYRRLIAINDKPLLEKTEEKEQKKLEKKIEKMQDETPKQRKKRLAEVEKNREEGKKFLEEITKAFDFRLIGEEEVAGVTVHVISAEPKEGYKPTSSDSKVLAKMRGKLWVSKDEYAWVRVDMETFANVRWAVVFKLRKGAKIQFTQHRLNDEVWLPSSSYVRMRAGAALVFKFNGEFISSYSNYRRFKTGSTVVDD
jgi:hypothetical protein